MLDLDALLAQVEAGQVGAGTGFPVEFYSYSSNRDDFEKAATDAFRAGLGPGPIRSANTLLKKAVARLKKTFPGYGFVVKEGVVYGTPASYVVEVATDKDSLIFRLGIRSSVVRRDGYDSGYYKIRAPEFELGFWPARYGAYPTHAVTGTKMPTMRDVSKLLSTYGSEKLLTALGGPLVGKRKAKSLSEVESFIRGLRTWFVLEEDEGGKSLLYATRQGGSVGDETPGSDDIREAQAIRNAVLAQYGAGSVEVELEVVDEWVHITVSLKRQGSAQVWAMPMISSVPSGWKPRYGRDWTRGQRWAQESASFLPLPGSRNTADLAKQLQPLRDAMDEVFRCDTAYGTCHPAAPSAGHCMLASMVVQDLFGGEIVGGEVKKIPHYWNRIGGQDVDITGDQFGFAEVRVKKGPLHKGTVFNRAPQETLGQPYNAEVTKLHKRFVKRLIPVLRAAGQTEWAKQLSDPAKKAA